MNFVLTIVKTIIKRNTNSVYKYLKLEKHVQLKQEIKYA